MLLAILDHYYTSPLRIISTFPSNQRIFIKMWNNILDSIFITHNFQSGLIFMYSDLTYAKEIPLCILDINIFVILSYLKSRRDIFTFIGVLYIDGEATFSISKPSYPIRIKIGGRIREMFQGKKTKYFISICKKLRFIYGTGIVPLISNDFDSHFRINQLVH
jgi:hypothetical protein